MLVGALGCDQGAQHDQQPAGAGPHLHVVAQNVSVGVALPANGRIELAFDRYLLPASITRQTFVLHDLRMNFLTPIVAYDPVARIVTITPPAPLQADQTYALNIASPSSPSDPNGLRSIDGATIDPRFARIDFPVRAADAGAPQSVPPTVDFCRDILPIFVRKCAGMACHGGVAPGPAAGLRLDSPAAIAATAIGRVAQGANTGPRSSPQPPGTIFGVDMPIIDPGNGAGSGGNPADSWLVYKLLLAVPPAKAPEATVCDGGPPPTDVSAAHLVTQPAFADAVNDSARAGLTDDVLGREMPYPDNPATPLGESSAPLTVDELERVSLWIAQPPPPGGGSLLPSRCVCGP